MLDLPQVIAHRGARSLAPENTLIAFKVAKEQGAQWVEFDIMLTADKKAVVIHDTNVKRTTDGKGEVSSLSYEQISQLDAGSWFSDEFAGERVPLLIDVIGCLEELQMGANFEIKPCAGFERETAIATVEIIHKYWPQSLPAPLVSSFSFESLRVVRELDSNIKLGLLLHSWKSYWSKLADELGCVTVHLNHLIATAKRVREIKDSGRYVLCYTVNSAKRAKRLFSWGVDSVFSDHPGRILSAL